MLKDWHTIDTPTEKMVRQMFSRPKVAPDGAEWLRSVGMVREQNLTFQWATQYQRSVGSEGILE